MRNDCIPPEFSPLKLLKNILEKKILYVKK